MPARNGCVGFPGYYTTSAAHHSHHHHHRCRYPHPHRHRPQPNHNYFNYTLSLQAHSAHYTVLPSCNCFLGVSSLMLRVQWGFSNYAVWNFSDYLFVLICCAFLVSSKKYAVFCLKVLLIRISKIN